MLDDLGNGVLGYLGHGLGRYIHMNEDFSPLLICLAPEAVSDATKLPVAGV